MKKEILLGPHARLDIVDKNKAESKAIYTLRQANEVVYPVVDGEIIHLFREGRLINDGAENFSPHSDCLCKDGVIIPYDLVDVNYAENNSLLRGLPSFDFIFVGRENGRTVVRPVDIKTNYNHPCPNQISEFNLAYLITISPSLREAISLASEDRAEIKIAPGGLVVDGMVSSWGFRENVDQSRHLGLEDYVSAYLEEKEIMGAAKFDPAFPFIELGKDFSVDYSKSAMVEMISGADFISDIRDIKNQIQNKGFYFSPVLAVEGFSHEGFPELLFEYNPFSKVITYPPHEIEMLEKEVNNIMSKPPSKIHEEYFSGLKDQFISRYGRRSRDLRRAIESKEDQLNRLIEDMGKICKENDLSSIDEYFHDLNSKIQSIIEHRRILKKGKSEYARLKMYDAVKKVESEISVFNREEYNLRKRYLHEIKKSETTELNNLVKFYDQIHETLKQKKKDLCNLEITYSKNYASLINESKNLDWNISDGFKFLEEIRQNLLNMTQDQLSRYRKKHLVREKRDRNLNRSMRRYMASLMKDTVFSLDNSCIHTHILYLDLRNGSNSGHVYKITFY